MNRGSQTYPRDRRLWSPEIKRIHCADWADLTTDQEDIFWGWVEGNGLMGWLRKYFPCETELMVGRTYMDRPDHGPDLDDPEDPNEA